jgi:intein-encoded DNA endonuclease-like protein
MSKTIKSKMSEYKNYILKNHETLSVKQMARDLDISSCSAFSIAKTLNLKSKPNKYFVTFKFNSDYFTYIDTKDKAYFLGLMYADGNIHKTPAGRKRVQIALMTCDSYILELFKTYLEYPGKLYDDKNSKRLMFHNEKVFDDLLSLGCIERKSLILSTMPKLEKKFIPHFLRGYFDGNGGILLDKRKQLSANISFSSTEMFLNCIKNILEKLNIKVSRFYKRYKEHEISAGSIHIYFTKNKNAELYNYLYQDCENLYLKRKKEKFEHILFDTL